MKKIILLLSLILSVSALALAQNGGVALSGDELFGDLRARHIGPALMSGRVIDLEGHPDNSRVLYVGTAGGGVWKSQNGGVTFQPIFEDYCQSIGAVALNPANPDQEIWVGTGEIWTRNSVSVGDGLYRSKDGGANWEQLGFEKSERISSIVFNPENPQEVYVGVLGALWSDSKERGVYKTTDGGASWEKILFTDATTGCSDLVMDPNNPEVLYASMWAFRRTGWSFESGGAQSALYKSTDGGQNWKKIHQGFPEGKLGRIALALAPSNPNILYAVLETEDSQRNGLWRSDNAGANWEHLNADFGLTVRPFYFSRIVIDPKDPEVIVKAGLTGSISRDGGKTFKTLGPMHADIHDILFDPHDSDRMYVGTDGGVYRSWDGGSTLEIVGNLPLSQFYHISLDDATPYNVYGGLQDNGSWFGPSSSPGGVEPGDWTSVGYGDGFRVLKHPTEPIVYSEMQGAENIWRFNTETRQVKSIQPLPQSEEEDLRFNWNTPIALSPNAPDRLYAGSQFLHRSNDQGDTWERISPDLTTNDPEKQNQASSGGLSVDNSGAENHCTIFIIAESPGDEKVIYVGTDDGNVQVTRNGGKDWSDVTNNLSGLPANTWCYHIEASVQAPGTAYAVFEGHTSGDWTPYVYKTSDFGQSWSNIATDDINGFARNIQEDYVNPDILYLGTEFGLYVTLDGGQHWAQFTNNLPPVAIHYIDLHPRTHDLVLGTHGRGIIIIDDISPLRQINQEVLNQDLAFLKTPPGIIREESGFGGTANEVEFVGPNPDRSAKVMYYLKKRHVFGKMKMEVFDQDGELVTELSPGKKKGINVVSWNGLSSAPKVAAGKSFAFASPKRAPAGTYTVVLTKGKDTYETTIELQNDPKSIWKPADRQQHEAITQELFDLNEDLAYLDYQIEEMHTMVNGLIEKEPKAAKDLQPYVDALKGLKESIVVTTGDNYVGSAEPLLREKLAALYSKVADGFAPPSSSELANKELLSGQLQEAWDAYGNLESKYGKSLSKWLDKLEMPTVELKSKEAFLER